MRKLIRLNLRLKNMKMPNRIIFVNYAEKTMVPHSSESLKLFFTRLHIPLSVSLHVSFQGFAKYHFKKLFGK